MTTALPPDFESFTHFMEKRFSNGTASTLEEGVQAFREYQRQLADLRAKVAVAREQVARGECVPLDFEELKREIRAELAKEGITD